MDRFSWPGARWWLCDLHTHTDASHDFKGSADIEGWIQSAAMADLDVVAITDHNSAGSVDAAAKTSLVLDGSIVVFPGVELTTSEGVHLLVLFPPGTDSTQVNAFLTACEVPAEQFGKPEAYAKQSFIKCLEIASDDRFSAISIAAHADFAAAETTSKPTSLLHRIEGIQLVEILESPDLYAAEVRTTESARHDQLRAVDPATKRPRRACIAASDAHKEGDIGARSTWLKMSKPDFQGLRLSLTDGELSVKVNTGADPNEHADVVLESLEVRDAKLVGRSKPFVINFNPWLNALIGGRGTGKSSLVEFLRLAMDRVDELPEPLATEFNSFAKVPGSRESRGLLTEDTEVSVVVRKEGTRFRLEWALDTTKPTISEWDPSSGTWNRADGVVAERFPIRIYSQKQVFQIAENPESLLSVIDDDPSVQKAEWTAEFRKAQNAYLTSCARLRELEVELKEETRVLGELADVKKKLEIFETAKHADVLREYQHRQRQLRALDEWEDAQEALIEDLKRSTTSGLPKLDTSLFKSSIEAESSALEEVKALESAQTSSIDAVNSQIDNMSRAIAEWKKSRKKSALTKSAATAKKKYDALVAELEAGGVSSPGEYADLVDDRQQLESEIAGFKALRSEVRDERNRKKQHLERVIGLRDDLTDRRRAFVKKVTSSNEYVRVEVIPYGDPVDAEASFRGLLGRDVGFDDDLAASSQGGLLGQLFNRDSGAPSKRDLASLRSNIKKCANQDDPGWKLRDNRLGPAIAKLAPETIDRFQFWAPGDAISISYRDEKTASMKPIVQASPGQKTAAILAFLLSYGTEPIVLDQPEDDLDNRLISSLIVEHLRENKKRRQIVVVTHNANIVVNGDAEYVAPLEFSNGETHIVSDGGLQEVAVREEVCAIMEGGRVAFEQRYRRIGKYLH